MPVLRARLKKLDGEFVNADLNLAERVKNENGLLEYGECNPYRLSPIRLLMFPSYFDSVLIVSRPCPQPAESLLLPVFLSQLRLCLPYWFFSEMHVGFRSKPTDTQYSLIARIA